MPLVSDFMLGGLASVGATCFTNPMEVIKTRIQLQGELSKRGTYFKPYKGVFNAMYTVARNEGILALQKGLVPALIFQFFINSSRLSMYTNAVKQGWAQSKDGQISFLRSLFWGGIGGVVGGYVASPFFLIKTRLQAQAAQEVTVGFQHEHAGMIDGFKKIYSKNGLLGLWYGASASIPRTFISSSSQIATFGVAKEKLVEYDIVTQRTLNSFCGGLLAGSVTALSSTPADVILTRLYNQPLDERGRGTIYSGWGDCFMKILKTEGIYGLYKGFWPNYVRFAPQATITLLLFDELVALRNYYRQKTID